MPRVKAVTKRTTKKINMRDRARLLVNNLVENASIVRSSILTKLFDDRRDIDFECGYPKEIKMEQYETLYQREGIAQRVVSILPEDSWSEDPAVYETEDPENQTVFEEMWEALLKEKNLFHYLHRADELSGVGRFGILLLGLSDGKMLNESVEGINERGEAAFNDEGRYELIYLRAFSESNVDIKSREHDRTNPRFGQPVMYNVTFQEDVGPLTSKEMEVVTGDKSKSYTKTTEVEVHWTRVIHIADNRKTSEIYGTPRMKPVYNRLYDIRKILSGSGEMFWKGAFPGYSFEMTPDATEDGATVDADSLRTEFEKYSNGLQRYLAITGLSAKSLAPQVSDPKAHIETQLRAIAITLGVPYRIFLGTEEAKLASVQDVTTWNKRTNKRQDKYITPLILRPFIDRLIALGILPAPAEENGYTVMWPDLNAPTDKDKADNAKIKAEALSKYLAGGVDTLIPPEEWLKMFMGLSQQEVDQIMKSAETYIAETEVDEDELEEDDEETEEDEEEQEAG